VSRASTPAARESFGLRKIFSLAWPLVVANASIPLLSLVDTAVIGHAGPVESLGAIALGSLVFNFLYWGLGFLRMATTGFSAQAAGLGDSAEVRAIFFRALGLALLLGSFLIPLRPLVNNVAFSLLDATESVEEAAQAYVAWRLFGAPASLGLFAVFGLLVGLGKTRTLLIVQLVLNGLNIGLDYLFAGIFGWGVQGIAGGTAVASWLAFGLALALIRRAFQANRTDGEPLIPVRRLFAHNKMRTLLSANTDILIRTLFLLLGFAWFTNAGARFGTVTLASNHVLLQLITGCAYLLDGYAHAIESIVGKALGKGARHTFEAALRSSVKLSAVSSVGLAALVLLLGPGLIRWLTDLEPVHREALRWLPWTAAYVLVSFAAFLLDGVFIGATRTRDMRNASALAFALFVATSWLLMPKLGNAGLWMGFVLWVIARAIGLWRCLPALRASLEGERFAGES